MRYNIIINQVKSKEWGLNLQQAFVFSFFYELPSWADSIIEDDNIYYFASKNKAIEELPILTEKIDTMYRIYKQIEEKGLVSVIKKNGKDYILITEKGKSWNEVKSNSEKNPNKFGKKSENNSEKNPTYNNTSINNIDTDNIKGLQEDPIDFDALLVFFNNTTGRRFRTINTKAKKGFKNIISEGYTKKDIRDAIINCFNSEYHQEHRQYLTPEFISRMEKFEKYFDTKNKVDVLPSDWFHRELSEGQKELLDAKQLDMWKRNKNAIEMEGGRLYPIKLIKK